ncbi:YhcN/YlaJ family sporulation lipoprotein [Bacillus sp. RG28]|uniref:YhcN/YlaJ family sporulation lipoprotein n=1 Tax=Gottfriedia endophytica TaxID=2820819 RepID=A0A940NRP7_9BACI|nr:YhcN/YlaJ family sporulation lipoprotein [Gottfriedia endophytica]MBP0725621.1 YhcN/YlaJ family sporulation lipoprotein [Gottfriedia endophytica]
MNKTLIPIIFILFLSACSFGHSKSQQFNATNMSSKNPPSLTNVSTKNQLSDQAVKDMHSYKDYGFSRLQKQDISGKQHEYLPKVDKQKLARSISYLVVNLPNVTDAATLVTDAEVFVAYQTNGNNKLVASQVRDTSLVTVPRFYKVYTSNKLQDINAIMEIQNIGTLSNNKVEAYLKSLETSFQTGAPVDKNVITK